MRAMQSFSDFYKGLQSPGGPLAKPSENTAKATGHAAQGVITGAAIGALTGTGSALFPEGLSPKALAVGALGTAAVAAWQAGSGWGRVAANASVAFSALAAHEYMGNKVTQKAGTATQVLSNKAKAIAAHGDADMHGDMGADPLVEWGARAFKAA